MKMGKVTTPLTDFLCELNRGLIHERKKNRLVFVEGFLRKWAFEETQTRHYSKISIGFDGRHGSDAENTRRANGNAVTFLLWGEIGVV